MVELQKQGINYAVDSLTENSICISEKDSISNLLKKNNCSNLLFPESCTFYKKIIKNREWRNGSSGPSYDRPEKTVIKAKISMLVYRQDGTLQYKREIEGKSCKPFMYNFFTRFSRKNSVEEYARSLYSPPELKAMYKAIKNICTTYPAD